MAVHDDALHPANKLVSLFIVRAALFFSSYISSIEKQRSTFAVISDKFIMKKVEHLLPKKNSQQYNKRAVLPLLLLLRTARKMLTAESQSHWAK